MKRLPTTESLSVDFSSLDFTEALGPVTFHLAEGARDETWISVWPCLEYFGVWPQEEGAVWPIFSRRCDLDSWFWACVDQISRGQWKTNEDDLEERDPQTSWSRSLQVKQKTRANS